MPVYHRRLDREKGLDPLLEICDRQVCFRATRPGRDVLLLKEACPWEGRYHARGEPQPLYTSLEQETARREFDRALERYGVRPVEAVVDVSELMFSGKVLNVADQDGQRGLRLRKEDLIADDVTLCQDVARFARSLGVDGILSPSAARLGHENLVVLYESAASTVRPVTPR